LGVRVTGIRAGRGPAAPGVSESGTLHDLPRLAAGAMAVINTLPLTDATRGGFDSRFFAAARPGSWFINVGRGATVVTADLVDALRTGRIAGAGLDVVDPDPLPWRHPLRRLRNVVVTPHMAGSAAVTRRNEWLVMRENLRRYAAGEPMLCVARLERGY
jgi:phosphoglycerate dehydrogenase-like enzyme